MTVPPFEVYALALEVGVWDVAAWGDRITHAQLVDWLAYRNERTRRNAEYAKRKPPATVATYR